MDCRTQLASLAIEELDKGDFLMATKILTTGIKMEPNNHELYFERSICYHKLADYKASLDDANAAIRLNSSDYTIHYQKGLALIGLSMFPEAVASFKKAIELRAKQDDSKLSDIFKLLRDATNELNTARRRPGATNHQARVEAPPVANTNQASTAPMIIQGVSNHSVDSASDESAIKSSLISDHNKNVTSIDNVNNNGSNSLVSTNCNDQSNYNPNQVLNGTYAANQVSSQASQSNKSNNKSSISVSQDISNIVTQHDTLVNQAGQLIIQSKSGQYEWNIRRSERIFLHGNDPSTSSPQLNSLSRQNDQNTRQKTGSNPSSISSGRGANKRPIDNEFQASLPYKIPRSRDGTTNSHVDSDVDVDDSYNPQFKPANEPNDPVQGCKRVMIAPSSSMPASGQDPSRPATSKDDSYSSKYKRLRRDRERARRGTSKLCTIKLSDLEELQKPLNDGSEKRSMRVIAPIDGWLYSGQLSIDDNFSNNGTQQYVVRLDGDSTGSSYLFTQDTVLNDVIKEVRVKTVSELRKGARICCYWSRTYKCLSTGVVTSRTFEATKSLVSVKYDNGDLSALPLEDLRLLPPDYPKYMSNCDPLLLARNCEGAQDSASVGVQNGGRIIVEGKSTSTVTNGSSNAMNSVCSMPENSVPEATQPCENFSETNGDTDISEQRIALDTEDIQESIDNHEHLGLKHEDNDDATIPPTSETIDFITSEAIDHQDEDLSPPNLIVDDEQLETTKDSITLTNETQATNITSRASSEENNYGIEYRPWMFEGPPKRNKRHGRTYRDNYSAIRRGNEVLRIGDSAELMPRDESILPFIAKIDGLWATGRGEMRVRVRWYYRLIETEGEPYKLKDGENALFETDHFDENDVQSIYRSTQILSWTDYSKEHQGHDNKHVDKPKIFYLAGYYDPVRRVKHLRSDVKEAQ